MGTTKTGKNKEKVVDVNASVASIDDLIKENEELMKEIRRKKEAFFSSKWMR